MARDPNDEQRKRYETSLGLELGSLFAELWQELAWLHSLWDEFLVIFGTDTAKLETANEAAGTFFFMLQKVLIESIFLHLSLLTDSPQTMKAKNLSVTRLAALVKPELRTEIFELTENAKNLTGFARDWRNRYIAHKDLPLALGDHNAAPLEVANRSAIQAALRALDDILNSIDKNYNDATTMFSKSIEPHHGAGRLIQLLQKGLDAEETERLEMMGRSGLA